VSTSLSGAMAGKQMQPWTRNRKAPKLTFTQDFAGTSNLLMSSQFTLWASSKIKAAVTVSAKSMNGNSQIGPQEALGMHQKTVAFTGEDATHLVSASPMRDVGAEPKCSVAEKQIPNSATCKR
jgi:hypothetical protein